MLYVKIKRDSKISLSTQIYTFIKESILSGTIKPDEKLPSTRELSKHLNVSRNVVLDSYEHLAAEGYTYTTNGSGTYVTNGVQLQIKNIISNVSNSKKLDDKAQKNSICFRTGIPDLSNIPIKKWSHIYNKICLDINSEKLDYGEPFGDYELRRQLALYLNRARGTMASPENIIITNGAAQSFSLICSLISPSNYALVENPLSYGILHTLVNNNINIATINLDEHGMITSELPENPPKFIFTTPSHQFPTGVILPADRRIELVKYARNNSVFIVEDDYDSEFRFDGNPIQSLQYLDPQHVIYVGTFSKTLMPALRIGYMVLPPSLCRQMKEIKYVADLHSPILEQLTLAQFIESGLFEQHIRKMKKLYLKKRNRLIYCLNKSFKDKISISGAAVGLHLVVSFKNIFFDKVLMDKINHAGIEITSLSKHYLSATKISSYSDSLVFGYGNTKFEDIEKGIDILYSVIHSV